MKSSIIEIGRNLLLGGAALLLVGCAAPQKMTKDERAELMKKCEVKRPTGSGIERMICRPDEGVHMQMGQGVGQGAPFYSAARRPISDFDEP